MSNNSNLHTSKRNKNDEYYTYYEDVVKGLEPYKEYLKGKRVLCPCDTDESNFVKYLKELGVSNWRERRILKIVLKNGYNPKECIRLTHLNKK